MASLQSSGVARTYTVPIPAPCEEINAAPGFNLGLAERKGKVELRSLEALVQLATDDRSSTTLGWIAIDDRGDHWIHLKSPVDQRLYRYFDVAKSRQSPDALFSPLFGKSIPSGTDLVSCVFIESK